MNWLIRIYNQNRKLLLIIIIIIVLIILIIQGLNYLASRQIEENNEEAEREALEMNQIYNRDESLLYGENAVSSNYAEQYNNIIDSFMNYCLSGDTANAYNLLSTMCKEELYPSQQEFERQYYNNVFGENKTYNFQYWASRTYQVTILDDILKTGGTGEKTVDYYTLVEEDDGYKLNINGFIGRNDEEITQSQDGIDITIETISQYNDYAIYNFRIKNNTDKNILMDSQNSTSTIYALNGNDNDAVRLRAYTEELNYTDLLVNSGEEKEISLRFSTGYSSTINPDSIVFSDIIMDYDSYMADSTNYNNINSIQIIL